MNIYLYDGSFHSLLALICLLLDKNEIIIKDINKYQNNLLDTPINLKIENKKEKVNDIKKLLSYSILKVTYYTYLSNDENKETMIFKFIKEYLKYKNNIFCYRNIDCVNYVIKQSSYVSRENHKMKGFLRFEKKAEGFYYAEMAPTNNIICLLTNHFKNRLNTYFIIKDVNRRIYSIYDKKSIYYLKEDNIKKLNLEIKEEEKEIVKLWKEFFNTISIKERENLKTQMNFMPKKYWKYIIEMEDNNE